MLIIYSYIINVILIIYIIIMYYYIINFMLIIYKITDS